MSERRGLVLTVIVIVLALQFLVPARQLANDIPTRWGWQMYSASPEQVQIQAIDASGTIRPVLLTNHLYRTRWEVRFDESFLEEICRREPQVTALDVRWIPTERSAHHPCND